ncbi:universal stress protein [Nocardia vaccinii]|uniref:universal stress protein n=1 Tax=Nocardia vaccinii TaxID=1822 RepID=UPI000829E80D|nr:universal stress protein [Nocardia vaccinii]
MSARDTTQQNQDDDPQVTASAPVVVGVDGSDGSNAAVRWAAAYAAGHGRELHIVHGLGLVGINTVAGAYAVTVEAVVDAARAQGKTVIADAEHAARSAAPEVRLSSSLASDSPAGLLVERSSGAFALVIGSTGSAGTLAHLGSTLLAATAHAHSTVVVVPAGYTDRAGGPVVVGVDGSPVSERAIAAAFTEAADRHTDLIAVHVWADMDLGRLTGVGALPVDTGAEQAEQEVLAERLAGWQEKFPDVPVVRKTYLSAPGRRLAELSKSAQLVVVGSRGRGALTGLLLGSTSNFLVQHSDCPVMVVHSTAR